ncbi:hypothetical protein [Nonomuraea gerenzanensis]|uniref:Uncharacterized protein n=1 Tax=Nonomuraea gerenzanensis TaxID=93944 RepID=A0A1M4EBN0_9ACTN|nr:hypothetical protein [Nonomuraea gerenzanensis]UBU18518.1 hypothetical protein LCN96_26905 [Nonomuraea gerenzanensis]SBO96357.1 hypothetical protein BN4615_P5873 [Nonomuraea gerenzanensis]
MSHEEEFGFAFEERYRPLLAVLGVRPATCRLTLSEELLRVRFGPWLVLSPRHNVAGAELSGPFSPLKAIGVRVSMADGGLTFGSSTTQGVCLCFRRSVSGSEPFGLLRHPALTVTVEDPARLIGLLTARSRPAYP